MRNNAYFIEALARGLEVLALFNREHPTLSMSEIMSLTGFNKTTIYRILSTLEATGYLERNPTTRRYRPGIRVLSLGFTALNNLDVREVARPYLEELAQQFDLTSSLSILDSLQVVYIDRIRNREIVGVLLGLGARIPAHCSSMGKVMLANLSPEECKRRLDNVDLKPCTKRSLHDVKALLAELEQVRQQGYALNDGELSSGLRAVAAPIFDKQHVIAAINVSGSIDVISERRMRDELPPYVVETARRISSVVGATGA